MDEELAKEDRQYINETKLKTLLTGELSLEDLKVNMIVYDKLTYNTGKIIAIQDDHVVVEIGYNLYDGIKPQDLEIIKIQRNKPITHKFTDYTFEIE